jgi:hypothetical protein
MWTNLGCGFTHQRFPEWVIVDLCRGFELRNTRTTERRVLSAVEPGAALREAEVLIAEKAETH